MMVARVILMMQFLVKMDSEKYSTMVFNSHSLGSNNLNTIDGPTSCQGAENKESSTIVQSLFAQLCELF